MGGSLRVSSPSDRSEREADVVARRVLGMSGPTTLGSVVENEDEVVARCPGGCDCDEVIHRSDGDGHSHGGVSKSDITGLGAGRPLADSVRGFFEPRFETDLSQVRVHTNAEADGLAARVGARAFTHHQDVVFRSGEFRPHSGEGRRLLAHELTHAIQQKNGPSATAGALVLRYRKKSAFKFGECDGPLKEEQFSNAKTQPWIERIEIEFDSTVSDRNGETVPSGTARAIYKKNSAALAPVILSVSGGAPSFGFTDRGSFTVHRIETCGYNEVPQSPAEREGRGWPAIRYNKTGAASMHFAVFFNGPQALHIGPLDVGSHSCVHVDDGSLEKMQQINYHSVIKRTRVTVRYKDTVLEAVCCDRIAHLKRRAPNPCNSFDPKSCSP